jgi:hypothetical protein
MNHDKVHTTTHSVNLVLTLHVSFVTENGIDNNIINNITQWINEPHRWDVVFSPQSHTPHISVLPVHDECKVIGGSSQYECTVTRSHEDFIKHINENGI